MLFWFWKSYDDVSAALARAHKYDDIRFVGSF